VKVAVLGLGSAGSRHARNLLALGHDVVAFDPSPREAPAGVVLVESEQEAIRTSVAVVVASPNVLHAAQAVAALDEGRHVLVEKPLAITAEDALAVEQAALRGGLTCGVAMNLRFLGALEAFKALLAAGRLGTPRLAEAVFGYDLRRWRPDSDYRESYSARSELGGGIVLDAVHELDYLLWLLGPIASVAAETDRVSTLEIDVEDVALALLRFRSGAVGTVSLNFFEPAYRRGCVLVGTDAVARWDWGSDEILVRDGDGATDSLPAGDIEQTYADVVCDFVDAVESGGVPRTSCQEGVEAVRVAEAIKQSASEGRRIAL
jgi:predicted dehydrogenase